MSLEDLYESTKGLLFERFQSEIVETENGQIKTVNLQGSAVLTIGESFRGKPGIGILTGSKIRNDGISVMNNPKISPEHAFKTICVQSGRSLIKGDVEKTDLKKRGLLKLISDLGIAYEEKSDGVFLLISPFKRPSTSHRVYTLTVSLWVRCDLGDYYFAEYGGFHMTRLETIEKVVKKIHEGLLGMVSEVSKLASEDRHCSYLDDDLSRC